MYSDSSFLRSVWRRSFLVQASLNSSRMQNLGIAYALAPVIRQRRLSGDAARAFLLRHLKYFNTHSCLLSAVLGTTVHAEMDPETSEMEKDAAVPAMKTAMMGPYAALGGMFFGGALRPFAGAVAGALAFMGISLAPLFYLMLYVPFSLGIRRRGFDEGRKQGRQGIYYIAALDLTTKTRVVKWISLGFLAWLVVYYLETVFPETLSSGIPGFSLLGGLSATVLLSWIISRGVPAIVLLYSAVAVGGLLSWV